MKFLFFITFSLSTLAYGQQDWRLGDIFSDSPHKVLGINKNASKEEVNKAFKRMSVIYHQDRFLNHENQKLYQLCQLAQTNINLARQSILKNQFFSPVKMDQANFENPEIVKKLHSQVLSIRFKELSLDGIASDFTPSQIDKITNPNTPTSSSPSDIQKAIDAYIKNSGTNCVDKIIDTLGFVYTSELKYLA